MKTLVLVLLTLILAPELLAQKTQPEAPTCRIEVQLENIMNDDGHILIALYDKEGFMTRDNVQGGKAVIKEGKASYVFTGVPLGTYAVVALHDTNNNNRMDFNASGMPLEGWASSNNEMVMGPPDFDASKFDANKENIQLTLRF